MQSDFLRESWPISLSKLHVHYWVDPESWFGNNGEFHQLKEEAIPIHERYSIVPNIRRRWNVFIAFFLSLVADICRKMSDVFLLIIYIFVHCAMNAVLSRYDMSPSPFGRWGKTRAVALPSCHTWYNVLCHKLCQIDCPSCSIRKSDQKKQLSNHTLTYKYRLKYE